MDLFADAEPVDTVELFAGPGGWGEGARMLGLGLRAEGIEKNPHAVATARAAGHRRRLADVFDVHPAEYHDATGLIASPPCPTFSDGGLRTGRGNDYQKVLDAWTSIGWGIDPHEALRDMAVEDPRTALLAVAGVWALTMPNLTWLAMEQVPAVEYAWVDLAAELFAADWEWVNVVTTDAADWGAPSHRKRTYLMAHRTRPGLGVSFPPPGTPRRTMADALGWGAGHTMTTRGARKTSGGNAFPCDAPAWCMTGKARSWVRDDGRSLSASEVGTLTGFRADYPWSGSRTAQFQQAGDVMAPVMAAHVLGAVHRIDAAATVAAHLDDLYPHAAAA